MSIKELEKVVSHLSSEDLAAFSAWFEEFMADAWDHRIEEDARAGRLDEAGRKADSEFEAGRCKPL